YSLEVGAAIPTYVPGTEASVDQLAQFLREGSSGGERKFNTSTSNEITVNLSGLTDDGKQLARWAMETWEMVADIDFVEVSSGEMITVDDEDSGAFAYFPNSGSTSAGVELNVSTGWLNSSGTRLDTYSFQTYIHEFGHAIGLNHQGAYNYTGSPITYENHAEFVNDSWQLSVMSYFSQSENTTVDASFAYVTTAQMADIVAIQDLYGAAGAGSVTAGNTTYGRGSNVGNYLDEVFAQWATGQTSSDIGGNRVAVTLYDAGGVDTLDLGYLAANKAANIDLKGGTFSDIGNNIGTLGIALGTVIENLETGAGNDTIAGNEAGNVIETGLGNDSVDAGAGNDSVTGGAGADTLTGGLGTDSVTGGEGADSLFGNSGADVIEAGAGDDYVSGGSGGDTLDGGADDDMVYGRNGADVIYGGFGNDTLNGNDGQDALFGDDGNDDLAGGKGDDTVLGGAGDDELRGNNGADVVDGGAGQDTLNGGGGKDTLNGGTGNDLLEGQRGEDTLNGGTGNDILRGGDHADSFVFEAGHGADTIGDFDVSQDSLLLSLSLTGGETNVSAILDQFADDSGTFLVFDFGGGNTIAFEDVTSTTGFESQIELF
ncbi:MAG: M10 family metallopeptidase, partial [Pseudomonadota bacterium]